MWEEKKAEKRVNKLSRGARRRLYTSWRVRGKGEGMAV